MCFVDSAALTHEALADSTYSVVLYVTVHPAVTKITMTADRYHKIMCDSAIDLRIKLLMLGDSGGTI